MGCDGGYASGAFQWIINNGGIATELSYPYLQQVKNFAVINSPDDFDSDAIEKTGRLVQLQRQKQWHQSEGLRQRHQRL